MLLLPSNDFEDTRILVYRVNGFQYWLLNFVRSECISEEIREHHLVGLKHVELHLNQILMFTTEYRNSPSDNTLIRKNYYTIVDSRFTIDNEITYVSIGELIHSEFSHYSGNMALTFSSDNSQVGKTFRRIMTIYINIRTRKILNSIAKLAEYPFYYYATNLVVQNGIEYLTIYFRYRTPQNGVGMGRMFLISSHLSYVYKPISPPHGVHYDHSI